MQFTSREDIEAPIAFVFQNVTDFSAFERQALRRGADVRRLDAMPRPGVGSGWDVAFMFRGKERRVRAEISAFDPPDGYVIEMTAGGLRGRSTVELLALSRGRTRLTVTTDLEAQTLSSRLLLQSLRLARGNLSKRMSKRIADYAIEVQNRNARQG